MPQGDPYKTLFVSRLSYEVTERKLRHEFEEYGPIKRIRLVHDLDKGEGGGPVGAVWCGAACSFCGVGGCGSDCAVALASCVPGA